jgi:hypothetical protein
MRRKRLDFVNVWECFLPATPFVGSVRLADNPGLGQSMNTSAFLSIDLVKLPTGGLLGRITLVFPSTAIVFGSRKGGSYSPRAYLGLRTIGCLAFTKLTISYDFYFLER